MKHYLPPVISLLPSALPLSGARQVTVQEYRVVERLRTKDPMILSSSGMTFEALNACGTSVHGLTRVRMKCGR